jgi:hypothetical protein
MSGEHEKVKGRVGADLLDVVEEGDEDAGLSVPEDTMLDGDDASDLGEVNVDTDEGLKIPAVDERSSSASSTNWQGNEKMYVSFIFFIMSNFSYIFYVKNNLYHNTWITVFQPALLPSDKLLYSAYRQLLWSIFDMSVHNNHTNANSVDKIIAPFSYIGLNIYCPLVISLLLSTSYYNLYRRSYSLNSGRVPIVFTTVTCHLYK